MPKKKKAKGKKAGFLPFLPLAFSLPGVVASVLGLILPFASRLTKSPYTGKIDREVKTLSEWGRLHDASRDVGGRGFVSFSPARGLAWTVAISAALVLFLLVLSRVYPRSKDLIWTTAVAGVLTAFASVVFFIFAVFFAVSAGSDSVRVILSAAPFCTLGGGIVVGSSAFLAVRRDL